MSDTKTTIPTREPDGGFGSYMMWVTKAASWIGGIGDWRCGANIRTRGSDLMSNQERHERFVFEFLERNPHLNRAAVRSGMFDAAHLCDAIAKDIQEAHRSRGKVTKLGMKIAQAVEKAGNAIWEMREKINDR